MSTGRRAGPSLAILGDRRLARLASKGDPRAFGAIYERYHQDLFRYCRSITGNAEDASDALQNTMTQAMRALPGERREIALRAWLFRIAHNEAVSVIRRRQPSVELTVRHGLGDKRQTRREAGAQNQGPPPEAAQLPRRQR